MGKKSRVKTQKSGTGATASVSPKETLNLTSELLQSKFRLGFPPSRGAVLLRSFHPQAAQDSLWHGKTGNETDLGSDPS